MAHLNSALVVSRTDLHFEWNLFALIELITVMLCSIDRLKRGSIIPTAVINHYRCYSYLYSKKEQMTMKRIINNIGHFLLGCYSLLSQCVAMVTVNGSWSEWTSWTTCSTTCGLGNATRARWCVSPAPAYGGVNCVGTGIEIKQCTDAFCPGKIGV